MNKTLEDLLCVIHRDGGQYIAEHGIEKAFDDALEIHYKQRDALEKLEKETNKTKRFKISEEISDKFITANGYAVLREKLLSMPFCFNKCKKLSKEIHALRIKAWNMIYEIYPDLRNKKLIARADTNEIEIL